MDELGILSKLHEEKKNATIRIAEIEAELNNIQATYSYMEYYRYKLDQALLLSWNYLTEDMKREEELGKLCVKIANAIMFKSKGEITDAVDAMQMTASMNLYLAKLIVEDHHNNPGKSVLYNDDLDKRIIREQQILDFCKEVQECLKEEK